MVRTLILIIVQADTLNEQILPGLFLSTVMPYQVLYKDLVQGRRKVQNSKWASAQTVLNTDTNMKGS